MVRPDIPGWNLLVKPQVTDEAKLMFVQVAPPYCYSRAFGAVLVRP
ncbi:MAG: hypothetical protein WAM97_02870 [Acidimicrobiales bacterium]